MADPLYCTLRGCMEHTERRADETPVDRHWILHTWGNQRRAFCSELHFKQWRATHPTPTRSDADPT